MSTFKMPVPESNGFVKTLNNMGFMTSALDPYSEKFVRFSLDAPGRSLDIGAAYGVASIAALRAGASVIANDVDERHLILLRDRVPTQHLGRLTLLPGNFLDIEVNKNSLGAILICRVLRFFDGERIQLAATRIFDWLALGGKVFVVAETPYLGNFSQFIPIYEQRKKEQHPWPGFIENVMEFAPERGKSLPPTMHLLDVEVLTRVFSKAGFAIEEVNTFARTDFPKDIQLDGRESVGLIARKV